MQTVADVIFTDIILNKWICNEFKVDASMTQAVPIKVQATDGEGKTFSITLEPINFIW